MSKTLRPIVVAGLAGLIGLTGAGCGAEASSQPGTTSRSRTTSSLRDTELTAQGRAVKFAACVRVHGVPHFPDPDAKGDFDFGVDVTPDVFTKAVNACKALKPPGALSSKRSPKEQSASLKFAVCMRAHGVEDFPDPVQGQPAIDTTRIPSSNRPGGMTILNAAIARCKSALDDALAGP